MRLNHTQTAFHQAHCFDSVFLCIFEIITMKLMRSIDQFQWNILESRTQGSCRNNNRWFDCQWCRSCTRLFGRQIWHIQIDSITRSSCWSSFYQSVTISWIPGKEPEWNGLGSRPSAYVTCQGKTMLFDIASAELNRSVYHRCQWCCFQTDGEIRRQVSHRMLLCQTKSIQP